MPSWLPAERQPVGVVLADVAWGLTRFGVGATTLDSPATPATSWANGAGRVAALANCATRTPSARRTVMTGVANARAMSSVEPLRCSTMRPLLRAPTCSP